VGGQPGLNLPAGGVDATQKQRVTWQFDVVEQRLTRAAWPTLYPVSAAQQGPAVPVLDGVTGLGLRSYWVGEGWIEGLRPPDGNQINTSAASGDDDRAEGAVPEIYSNTLPHAVEITLETSTYGQIVLLEYFQ
jgi:general secretion pathway protein J